MLAEIQTLTKEKEDYKLRVEFLEKYIDKIVNNTYDSELDQLEWLDKSYALQKELGFKKVLIKQREQQIKLAEEKGERQKAVYAKMGATIEDAKSAMMVIVGDLEALAKKKKRNQLENETLKGLKLEVDQNTMIINGCSARFENSNDNPHYRGIENDFRQLHEIINKAK